MFSICWKKHIVLIICLILILFVAGGDTYYGAANMYLEKNHADIDIDSINLIAQFSIHDSDIEKNTVILTGEEHAVKDNYKLKLVLIKYLNQKYGVKYILAEIGLRTVNWIMYIYHN